MNIDDLEDPADVLDALSAAHEAGHVVVYELLGCAYELVTLGDEQGPARVEAVPVGNADSDAIERDVLCAFAGVVAEATIFFRRPPIETVVGGIGDRDHVRTLLGPRAADRRFVETLLLKTQRIVQANIRQIRRVAKALLARRRLTPAEVRATYDGMPLEMPQ